MTECKQQDSPLQTKVNQAIRIDTLSLDLSQCTRQKRIS